jgi:hypothetical protein
MKTQAGKLTSFALNEFEGDDVREFTALLARDGSARAAVADVQKMSKLIQDALTMEASGGVNTAERTLVGRASAKKSWLLIPAAAAAAFLMMFGLPYIHHKDQGFTVDVEADAFAATFSPGVDREAVRKTVQDHLGELKKCYEDVLAGQPNLAGKILVRFSFAADGMVSEAAIAKSTMKSAAVEGCIVERVKSWKFSGAPKDVKAVVEYPFIFDSK